MSSYIDLKFINDVSGRLEQFKKKTDYLFNFRCPHCGDSKKSKTKARAYLYRVKNDDKEKTLRYFQISSYTSDKHYEMTHDVSEDYQALWDDMWDSDIGKKVWTFDNKTHIYRKVFRVNN